VAHLSASAQDDGGAWLSGGSDGAGPLRARGRTDPDRL